MHAKARLPNRGVARNGHIRARLHNRQASAGSVTLYDSSMPSETQKLGSEIAIVAERFGLSDVYAFGSRAEEIASGVPHVAASPRSASDVDIAVRSHRSRPLTPGDRVELALALEQATGRSPVDLLILPEAGPFLALAAIRGNLLYCADPVAQAEYELFVLRRAGDLAPLERDRQQIVLNGGR